MKTTKPSGLLSFTPVRIAVFLLLICAVASSSPAQTFTSLVSFDVTNGAYPYSSSVVQGRDGNLYGTTSIGGANNGCGGHSGCGTFYRYNPATNTLTVLYSFCALSNCADGANPQAGVVLGSNGNFYGTTAFGGSTTEACFTGVVGCGTVFEVTPAGTLTTLHVFSGPDGGDPQGALLQATSGYFYGTTFKGGTSNDGTVFAMTPAGKLTTLHSFSGSDGTNPQSGVIQATNGGFYGTTPFGGTYSAGTVFAMTPTGTLTTIHNFDGSDGVFPNGLVQAADGNLYGTTDGGGTSTACDGGSCGTVFKMTLKGALTTLQNFDDGPDGADPSAALIQANDKNLYGSASSGGSSVSCSSGIAGCGVVFEITSANTLSPLHAFDGTDGSSPGAILLQATSGIFYGTTTSGGSSFNDCDCGTIFSSNTGLSPFVQALTYSGKVGSTIEFLGQDFTKSSTVSFNGTPATPTGGSGTFLTVKVPSGATTGIVTITTSKGSLQSNQSFRVIP